MSTLRRRGGSTASLLGLLCVVLAVAAARLPAQQETFGETTSTVVVEVPVQVIRDGAPVRGLTRGDFEVFDGRKKQELTGFEVIDLGPPGRRSRRRKRRPPPRRSRPPGVGTS